MNERILKLLTESGYVPIVGYDYANSIIEAWATKFAELIVRECVNCIENTDKGYIFTAKDAGIVNAAHTRSMKKVKEHFGICIGGIE